MSFFVPESEVKPDMAKGKYEYWLSDEGLTLLEGWARDGLTDEQISKNMGIAAGTLYDWKKKYPKISESLKKGKAVVDFEVESALLSKAKAGDVTAQIFWLKTGGRINGAISRKIPAKAAR